MAPRTLLPLAVLLAVAAPVGAQAPNFQSEHATACQLGDLLACSVLGLIYESGAGGVRDVGRAMDLYERACDRRVDAACVRLELLQTQSAPPPTDPFVRVGRVADADDGAPVPNVIIELPSLDLRRIADQWGRVDLGRLPRGNHRIVARRPGYADIEGQLPVPWDTEFLLFMFSDVEDESDDLGRVFGQVTDALTGRPLANVEVTLVADGEQRTLTNPDGRFSFAGVTPGSAEVRLSILGYQERSQELEVEAGRTVEVYAPLATQPIELDPIEVTVGSAYLERSGFYRRARGGAGYALSRRDLDRMNLLALSEVFRRVPGVFIERTRTGAQLVTRREAGRDVPGPCQLRPYLDGSPLPEWDIDQVLPDAVEGVEVYQGLAAPIEYRNLTNPDGTSPCGVVLIWTTRGGT